MKKEKRYCPRCNAELWPDSITCWSCKLNLQEPYTGPVIKVEQPKEKSYICPKCNAELWSDSIRCWSCGYVLPKEMSFIDEALNLYNSAREPINIPVKCPIVEIRSSSYKHSYLWKEQDSICLFPFFSQERLTESTNGNLDYRFEFLSAHGAHELKEIRIPTSNIEYFEARGDVFMENKISGGGGGGANIGGALLGAVIAGGAGAIIGGKQKVNAVTSEVIKHDNREVCLKYLDQEDVKREVIFGFDANDVLNELIPEKEHSIVNAIKTSQILAAQSPGSIRAEKSVADQIREFSKLKDEGIITQEEFDAKKRQLLGL